MSYFSGRDGSLYVDGTRMARVANWTLSASVEALETTSLGDNERNYTTGLKSATGTAAVFYYDEAPVPLLEKVIKTGAANDADDIVTLSLRWSDKKVDFQAIVTAAQLTAQVGAVMQANISFTVTDNYQDIAL